MSNLVLEPTMAGGGLHERSCTLWHPSLSYVIRPPIGHAGEKRDSG